MAKPEVLNILVDGTCENLEGLVTPTVSWQYYDVDGDVQQSYQLKIGTYPLGDDILDTGEVFSNDNQLFVAPTAYESQMRNGLKYFLTLEVSNSTEYSESKSSFFFVEGDYWKDNVDNSVGWTVEFYFKLEEIYADLGISPPIGAKHHDVEISDGTKSLSLELYVDRIIVRTEDTSQFFINNTDRNLFRITGSGSDYNLYINGEIALNGVGKNLVSTSQKILVFGSTTTALETTSQWTSVFIDIDGANTPQSLPGDYYNRSLTFYFEEVADTLFDYDSRTNIFVATNPYDTNQSGRIYKIHQNTQIDKFSTEPVLNSTANKIVIDEFSDKWVSTFNVLYKISGEKFIDFTKSINVTEESNLTEFELLENCSGICASFGSLLRVNTVSDNLNTFWYYQTVNNNNSKWFEKVSNDLGWVVEATLRIADDGNNTEESAGLIINDGVFQEKFYFLKDKLILKYAKKTMDFDFSNFTEVRIVGEKCDVSVYVKVNSSWKLLIDASGLFKEKAQIYSDSSISSSVVSSTQNVSSVWSTIKDDNFDLYLNKFNGLTWRCEERLTFSDGDSKSPDMIIDESVNHTVWQSNAFGNDEIFYGQYNGYRLIDVTRITNSVLESTNPKVAKTSNGDIHVVWIDGRNMQDEVFYAYYDDSLSTWISSSFDGEDEQISTFVTGNAKNVVLKSYNDNLYVIWEDDRNGVDSIYVAIKEDGVWQTEVLVSSLLSNAVNPDMVIKDDTAHIVWEDDRGAATDIFYNTFDGSLIGIEEQISNNGTNASKPRISTLKDSQLVFTWLNDNGSYKEILLARTFNNIFITSGNSFTDVLLSNSEVDNTFDLDVLNYEDSNKVQVSYLSSIGGYRTLFTYDLVVDNTLPTTVNINTSLKMSNVPASKSIAFGDISENDNTISEWKNISYYTDSIVTPLIVKSFRFDNIIDIFVSDRSNLFLIDNDGLHIFNLFINREKLVSNPEAEEAAISAPIDARLVYVDNLNNIYVARRERLFYHYPLVSNLTDPDNPWMEIDIQYDEELGDITTFSSYGDFLWIGFENGLIIADFNIFSLNNIISIDNSIFILNGSRVNSISFASFFAQVAHDAGIYRVNLESLNITNKTVTLDGFIDKYIEQSVVENDNEFWAFGKNGLIKSNNDVVEIFRDKLSTNNINHIALDNHANLWIANNLGVEVVNIDRDLIYSVNQSDGYGTVVTFEDYQIYKINANKIDEKNYFIAKVNGVFRENSEYIVDSVNRLMVYSSPLSPSSVSEVIFYTLSEIAFDFNDPTLTLQLNTTDRIEIIKLEKGQSDNQIIAFLKVNDDTVVFTLFTDNEIYDRTLLPFGIITFDKTPPTGTIDITEQININTVILALTASDEVSGVNSMVISNFPNFTSDGFNPISPVPFQDSVEFDIGLSSGQTSQQLVFPAPQDGNVLHEYSISNNDGTVNQNLLLGTKGEAVVYRLIESTQSWELVEVLAATDVLCMENHSEGLFLGTGGSGKLFFSSDAITFNLINEFPDGQVNSLLSATDNNLYIATGNNGNFYRYNGTSVELLFSIAEVSINDLTEFQGFIYMATGDSGRIYRYSIATGLLDIIYDDKDSEILSIGLGKDFNSDSTTVYAGTFPSGKILRFVHNRSLFTKSFQSNLTAAKRVRTFGDGEVINQTLIPVDHKLFRYNLNNWAVLYIQKQQLTINDAILFNNKLYITTDSAIENVLLDNDKKVFVKYIDFAGNETVLFDLEGELKPREDEDGNLLTERLWDSVDASETSGLTLTGRLIVFDENGDILKTITGDRPFLTGSRIDKETAIYLSQVFDGTNSLISWDKITFALTTPTNTEIQIQVRTSDDFTTLEEKDFSLAVTNGQDLSGLSGRFIQFKATLISSVRGISPVLNNVTITAKSSFAVHYFTTNFKLPSNLKSGLLAANTIAPDGTEIVFGVTTDTTATWENYKIIEPNKQFFIDENNTDANLKIGIRFLSSQTAFPAVDEFAMMFATEDGKLVKLNLSE